MGEPVQPGTLLAALKAVAAALKADGVPFALAGGFAVYARGGHPSLHDVDFVVPPESIPAARTAMERRNWEITQPPEDWLIKVWVEGHCVDVIHRLTGLAVDGRLLDRADEMQVESIIMPVLSANDLVASKLLALNEHHCDLEPLLGVTRSLREQIDLDVLEQACAGHPFAEAAIFLLRRLGILGSDGEPAPLASIVQAGQAANGTAPAGQASPGRQLQQPVGQEAT